jgi:hypothetical protein
MKKLNTIGFMLMLGIALLSACHSKKSLASAPVNVPPMDSVTFSGGNGSSMENAVVINNAKGSIEGINAEYYYIGYIEGKRGVEWQMKSQSLLNENGKYYDQIDITIAKTRKKKSYYFDITGFFGKW